MKEGIERGDKKERIDEGRGRKACIEGEGEERRRDRKKRIEDKGKKEGKKEKRIGMKR